MIHIFTARAGQDLDRAGAHEQRDELVLEFVRTQRAMMFTLPVLALVLAVFSLDQGNGIAVVIWLAVVLAGQAAQFHLCRLCERAGVAGAAEWAGSLAAAEFLCALIWIIPLFLFWQPDSMSQPLLLIFTLTAVAAVRVLASSPLVAAAFAGAGLIIAATAFKSVMVAQPPFLAVGAAVAVAGWLLAQLARRLNASARERLAFNRQREQLVRELRTRRDEAEQHQRWAVAANHAMSQFLGTMSHELRTPLNAILGFSELLNQKLTAAGALEFHREYASDIHKSGVYLLNLLDNILDASRMEANGRLLNEQPVDLAEAATDAIRLVVLKAHEKRQTIHTHFPSSGSLVMADACAARQIWQNLLSNAVKFTPRGGEIILTLEHGGDNGLIMSVADTGPGIPDDEMETVMAAFCRGSAAVEQDVDGAGLGLSIVRGLAELHDCAIKAENLPGAGVRFVIVFPPRRVLAAGGEACPRAHENETIGQKRLIAASALTTG